MRVTFSKDFSFAEDGIHQKAFLAGETYDVSRSCADSAAQVGAVVVPKPESAHGPDIEVPTKGRPGRKPRPQE